jgi:hypothetical protein
MARPYERVRAEGGGIWRVKWIDYNSQLLLVTACMHAGFQVSYYISLFHSFKIANKK